METNDLALFVCPPYPQYNEPPKDKSKCELVECPKCNEKMWLSEKKQAMLVLCKKLKKNILLCCYDCLIKTGEEDPNMFREMKRINL